MTTIVGGPVGGTSDPVDHAGTWRSPMLTLPGAVASEGADTGVPAHYGDPLREQRTYAAGEGFVDRSHRGVVTIAGVDRLTWVHSISTQQVESLAPGAAVTTLVLSPQGHVEFVIDLVDDGTAAWLLVEPDRVEGLLAFLTSMRFMLRVEVADATSEWATVTVPLGSTPPADLVVHAGTVGIDLLVPRDELAYRVGTLGAPVGLWAYEAARIAARVPRQGFETDHRTIPHEVGWIETAVSLTKGCYRGQETVARVHNLGSPPRRLVFLHLDGSVERLPAHGDVVVLAVGGSDPGAAAEAAEADATAATDAIDATGAADATGATGATGATAAAATAATETAETLPGKAPRPVGTVTSSAWHYELGPIALAVIKRTVPVDADLLAGDIPASQEVVVSPDAGLHVGVAIRENFRRLL